MEIPPLPIEVLGSPPRRSTLLPGLVWLFVGVALLLSFWEGEGVFAHVAGRWVWGLVPTGIGIAYLIHYLVEGRKLARPAQSPEPAQSPQLAQSPHPTQLPKDPT
jgi:hypothetical protein